MLWSLVLTATKYWLLHLLQKMADSAFRRHWVWVNSNDEAFRHRC
jgi:hypothetical protein